MKVILLVLSSLLLLSCNDASLGKGYYVLTDYESEDVGYPYGSIIYKSKDEDAFQHIVVYSDIKKCVVDGDFILVLQKPNERLIKKEFRDGLSFWQDHRDSRKNDTLISIMNIPISIAKIDRLMDNPNDVESKIDSILNHHQLLGTSKNYYIIMKSKDSIIGPLSKADFEKVKKQKGIGLNTSDW